MSYILVNLVWTIEGLEILRPNGWAPCMYSCARISETETVSNVFHSLLCKGLGWYVQFWTLSITEYSCSCYLGFLDACTPELGSGKYGISSSSPRFLQTIEFVSWSVFMWLFSLQFRVRKAPVLPYYENTSEDTFTGSCNSRTCFVCLQIVRFTPPGRWEISILKAFWKNMWNTTVCWHQHLMPVWPFVRLLCNLLY